MNKKYTTAEDDRIKQLEDALTAILHGTPLDEKGNRNDDGLVDFSAQRLPSAVQVRGWLILAKDGLKKSWEK